MGDKNGDFLRQAVELLQSHDVENFLIIAENPGSKGESGDEFGAVFGGDKDVIVSMLMEIFRRKENTLGFILDAFASLSHLDKIGQQGELDKLMAELKRG